MISSGSLADDARTLVADTSVIINLHDCGHGARILAAIPNEILIPEIVRNELVRDARDNQMSSFLRHLDDSGLASTIAMSEPEWDMYASLISDPVSLDDGEAATISIAVTRQLLPVLDERKGRARATELMDGQSPAWTLDIIRHPLVASALGDDSAVDALFRALSVGRMRIPSSSAEEVIATIGMDRALRCTCLPGYRQRFRSQAN